MGKVIASTFVTIDNFMVGENEDMSWVMENFDVVEMGDDMGGVMASMGTILLGQVTYSQMIQHWPFKTEAEDPGADQMNLTPKIVFSKSLKKAEWGKYGNATVAKEIDPKEIEKIKKQSDKNLVIFGSASIVQQFTNLGLIDEYRLWLHPVILGKGKLLFKNIESRHNLKLARSKTYNNGVMSLTLEPK